MPRHPNPWLCPVLALGEWRTTYETLLGRAAEPNEPVFPTLDRRTRLTDPMHRDAINDIVQRAAQRVGLHGDYGSHSPRAGFTTDCIDAGITREHVQHHGRWRNIRSLDPYYRKTSTWAPPTPPPASPNTTTEPLPQGRRQTSAPLAADTIRPGRRDRSRLLAAFTPVPSRAGFPP